MDRVQPVQKQCRKANVAQELQVMTENITVEYVCMDMCV